MKNTCQIFIVKSIFSVGFRLSMEIAFCSIRALSMHNPILFPMANGFFLFIICFLYICFAFWISFILHYFAKWFLIVFEERTFSVKERQLSFEEREFFGEEEDFPWRKRTFLEQNLFFTIFLWEICFFYYFWRKWYFSIFEKNSFLFSYYFFPFINFVFPAFGSRKVRDIF